MTDRKHNPRRGVTEIREEFNRAMNTPSPNPRYGGLTPIEALQRSARRTPKQEQKKSDRSLQA